MPYGRGPGMGRGFRGACAAWPYTGRGRGGLTRCGYFFAGQSYLWPGYARDDAYQATSSIAEINSAAANLRNQLMQIQARIDDLELQKTA